MLSINIIGAGRVGKTFGRLFFQQKTLRILDIYNFHEESNRGACEFIKAGRGILHLEELRFADITLIAVPDDQILKVAQYLADHKLLRPNSTALHCSGAYSSQMLSVLKGQSIAIASVHPVRSFSDPSFVANDFQGTICSVEGEQEALAILVPIFVQIGARVVEIAAKNKLLYHAASVFASNCLVSLIDIALQAFCAAGIDAETANAMALPLAQKSLEKVLNGGAIDALTGPIKRGDMQLVAAELIALKNWNADAGKLYEAFIAPTLDLANRKHNYSEK